MSEHALCVVLPDVSYICRSVLFDLILVHNSIGGNADISGVQTCWLGFIRNTVSRNVSYTNNILADPDGNEVVTNTIGRNLNCSGNDPAPAGRRLTG